MLICDWNVIFFYYYNIMSFRIKGIDLGQDFNIFINFLFIVNDI